MNVFVLAPHPDDEAIGCGGTLAHHAARGDRVAVVFLTSGELGLKHLPREQAWRIREAEAERAAEMLGLTAVEFLRRPDWLLSEDAREASRLLGQLLEREAPDRIYLPHSREAHPDHRACEPLLRAALRERRLPGPTLYAYEVWTPLSEFQLVKDVSDKMACKLRAVRCYRSQLAYVRYDRAVRGLNQYRGCVAGRCAYAEVFEAVARDAGLSPEASASLAGSAR
jgi:N-acetylglucosamine malate deacetylase 1